MKTTIKDLEKRIALTESRVKRNFEMLKEYIKEHNVTFGVKNSNYVCKYKGSRPIQKMYFDFERDALVIELEDETILLDGSVDNSNGILSLIKGIVEDAKRQNMQ